MVLERNAIVVRQSSIHGWGVFAEKDIQAGDLIEQCYYLHLEDYTDDIADYIFGQLRKIDGTEQISSFMLPLGYGAIYNHSDQPNAKYVYDEKIRIMKFLARKHIKCGDEIFITYGKEWFKGRDLLTTQSGLWFRTKYFISKHWGMLCVLLAASAMVLSIKLMQDLPAALAFTQ